MQFTYLPVLLPKGTRQYKFKLKYRRRNERNNAVKDVKSTLAREKSDCVPLLSQQTFVEVQPALASLMTKTSR